ncbi:hypothetical protein B2J93_679 [Marssonina coronariae]|uniref:Uncharacterized protein n=1 Tax=Diplocarpon coronariae TaxID=2795749 RepID=A0A218Z8T1_9HELO|nr:hypothetical protein B2J93_679 [Marssonina coronariae]
MIPPPPLDRRPGLVLLFGRSPWPPPAPPTDPAQLDGPRTGRGLSRKTGGGKGARDPPPSCPRRRRRRRRIAREFLLPPVPLPVPGPADITAGFLLGLPSPCRRRAPVCRGRRQVPPPLDAAAARQEKVLFRCTAGQCISHLAPGRHGRLACASRSFGMAKMQTPARPSAAVAVLTSAPKGGQGRATGGKISESAAQLLGQCGQSDMSHRGPCWQLSIHGRPALSLGLGDGREEIGRTPGQQRI